MERIHLKGDEFLRKLLEGEKDFFGIELRECDLSQLKGFDELYRYLKKEDFKVNPIDFRNSWFYKVTFGHVNYVSYPIPCGLQFPYAKGNNAWFVNSDLTYVNFRNGSFRSGSFGDSDLQYVDFRFADFYDANFGDSRLVWTDFRGAKNLGAVKNMEHAYFWNVIVTEEGEERRILERIIANRPSLHVKTENEVLVD